MMRVSRVKRPRNGLFQVGVLCAEEWLLVGIPGRRNA